MMLKGWTRTIIYTGKFFSQDIFDTIILYLIVCIIAIRDFFSSPILYNTVIEYH